MTTIDGTTQLVGIVGWPVTHSLSPAMHNAAFDELRMNWRYLAFPVREDDLRDALRGLSALGLRGVNVTLPHKVSAVSIVDTVTDAVQIVGALNTIRIDRTTGRLEGLNTDMAGFLTDLAVNDIQIDAQSHVIILGAGGAARACAAGMVRSGARVSILNRTLPNAQGLVDFLRVGWSEGRIRAETYETLPRLLDSATLVVNCTPVGMWPNTEASPWPGRVPIPRHVVVYDTIYRPLETRLVRDARKAGATALGGLGMLVYQGAAAFEAWTGRKPPVEVMRKVCEEALAPIASDL
jgi:shikimate dehydrogenase